MSKIRIPIVMIAATALIVMSAHAYEFDSRSLKKLYLDSSNVAEVEILSSDMFTVEYESDIIDCGNVYTAEVIREYKGNASIVQFATAARLPIRSRNIVFLAREFRDGAIQFTSMGANQVGEFRACMSAGVELYASLMHGEIYQVEYLPGSLAEPNTLRALSVNKPFGGEIVADKIEFLSPQLTTEDLDALSYWSIPWSFFDARLSALVRENVVDED